MLHSSGSYCQPCKKALPLVQCVQCSAPLRVPATVTAPLCGRCQRVGAYDDKPCQRCGRIPPRARRRIVDGQVACVSCANAMAPAKECFYCKRWGPHRYRDFVIGLTEPACGACRRRLSHIPNCAGCHRPRYPAGERDGKLYCHDCLPQGGPPLISCSICKQTRPRYAKRYCEDCCWERSHQKLLKVLAPNFTTPWARELFARYHNEALVRSKRGNWQKHLKRDVAFFLALEQHFEDVEDLSGVAIIERMGSVQARTYRRAMSYLAHAGLVTLNDDPDYAVAHQVDRLRITIARTTPWIAEVLSEYLDHLVEERARVPERAQHTTVPTKPESISACVRKALALLEFAESRNKRELRQLDQNTLELFLAQHKSNRLGVSSFVRYINAKGRVFRKLKLPKPGGATIPAHLFLPDAVRLGKIEWLAATVDPLKTRWALVGLFNLIYAQSLKNACAMRRTQVRETDTGYQVRFARAWLELDDVVVPLMRRWMGQRREISAFETGTNPFLFPGQQTGTHIQAFGFHFRREFGLSSREGRATAIATLVRNGFNQPRLLTDCLGISTNRATAYCEALGATTQGMTRFAMDAYGQ